MPELTNGNLSDSLRLSFSGYLSLRQIDHLEQEYPLLSNLQEEADSIADEIADRLGQMVGIAPRVSIEFRQGSIEWFGWVEWFRNAWPAVEAMATIGGAIGLIQLIKGAVDSIIRRRLRRHLGPRPLDPLPSSRVIVVSFPRSASLRPRLYSYVGGAVALSAFTASVGVLVAAIAYLISVLR